MLQISCEFKLTTVAWERFGQGICMGTVGRDDVMVLTVKEK